MKKIASLLLVLCMCLLAFTSCIVIETGNDSDKEVDNNLTTTTTTTTTKKSTTTTTKGCSHSWISATCENPKTCSKCYVTSGDALGHTTSVGKCTRCGKNFGTWIIGQFVDEFKQPTGEKYIITRINGVFSNSVTTNSKLSAALLMSSRYTAIMLWEYENFPVKSTYNNTVYDITIKNSVGQRYELTGTMYENTDMIFLTGFDDSIVIEALKQPGEVSFYIAEHDHAITNYFFTVETTNFKYLYDEIR